MWEPFSDIRIWRALAEALGATLRAASIAITLALLFGMVMAAGRLSRRAWLRWPAAVVVEFFRATPLVILLLFLFIGFSPEFNSFGEKLEDVLPERVSAILGIDQMESMGPLVVALTLYNGAVLAEIFRAGILAVPNGQREAALAVGLRESDVTRLVLLPQAVRIMLPAIVSQSVVALKDTSLGFIVVYPELVRVGRQISGAQNNIIPTAIVIAVIYVTLNSVLSYLAGLLQQRQARRYSREAVAGAASAVDVH
jgi:glutamate transport system permease protein